MVDSRAYRQGEHMHPSTTSTPKPSAASAAPAAPAAPAALTS